MKNLTDISTEILILHITPRLKFLKKLYRCVVSSVALGIITEANYILV